MSIDIALSTPACIEQGAHILEYNGFAVCCYDGTRPPQRHVEDLADAPDSEPLESLLAPDSDTHGPFDITPLPPVAYYRPIRGRTPFPADDWLQDTTLIAVPRGLLRVALDRAHAERPQERPAGKEGKCLACDLTRRYGRIWPQLQDINRILIDVTTEIA